MNLADKRKAKEITEKIKPLEEQMEGIIGKKISVEIDFENFFEKESQEVKEGAGNMVYAIEEFLKAFTQMCNEDFVKESVQKNIQGIKLSASSGIEKTSIHWEEGYVHTIIQITGPYSNWPIWADDIQKYLENTLE